MSEIIKPIMLDETGRALVEAIEDNNALQQQVTQLIAQVSQLQSGYNSLAISVTEPKAGHFVVSFVKN